MKTKEKIIEEWEKKFIEYWKFILKFKDDKNIDWEAVELEIRLEIRKLVDKLLSQQKQEMAEEIEKIRAKAHNGRDVYNDLIDLKQKLTK